MSKRGALNVPVIGIASSALTREQFCARVEASIDGNGGVDDAPALERLMSQVQFVSGNYNDAGTFNALKRTLGAARRPAHYLAAGYLDEPQVAKDSDVETFCAARLHLDSWRWGGVPWYLRPGKCLPETACEVLMRLRAPPQKPFADSAVREDATWRVAEPVLADHPRSIIYAPGTWGPPAADHLIAGDGGWHNPEYAT